uniref:Rho-GAP domain-containing protein n=1 Tax=Plectus sambesii TaxID=2011161 RepID=A0A914XM84_9BILA
MAMSTPIKKPQFATEEQKNKNRDRACELLAKLRMENPYRFETMAKMYISIYAEGQEGFTIDELNKIVSTSHDQDTPDSGSKNNKRWKKKRDSNGNIDGLFGAPLTQEGIAACEQLIVFLDREEVLSMEGLFRLSGSVSRQTELRTALSQGRLVNFEAENFKATDAASVLKMFLNELPEPLLTLAHFPVYLRISDFNRTASMSEGEQTKANVRRLKAIRLLVQLLPVENRQLLGMVLNLLKKVADRHEQNKMTALNLGTIFVPIFLHPRSGAETSDLSNGVKALSLLVSMMVTHAERVLRPPDDLLRDVLKHYDEGGAYQDCLVRTPESVLSAWGSPFTPTKSRKSKREDDLEVRPSITFAEKATATNTDCTSKEIADLAAHVQAMPDGPLKQKVLKRMQKLNREALGVKEKEKGLMKHLKTTFLDMKASYKQRRKSRSVDRLEVEEARSLAAASNLSRSLETNLESVTTASTSNSDVRSVQVGSTAYLQDKLAPDMRSQRTTSGTSFDYDLPVQALGLSDLPEATVDLSMLVSASPPKRVLREVQETKRGATMISVPSQKLPAFDEYRAKLSARQSNSDLFDGKRLASVRETFI